MYVKIHQKYIVYYISIFTKPYNIIYYQFSDQKLIVYYYVILLCVHMLYANDSFQDKMEIVKINKSGEYINNDLSNTFQKYR